MGPKTSFFFLCISAANPVNEVIDVVEGDNDSNNASAQGPSNRSLLMSMAVTAGNMTNAIVAAMAASLARWAMLEFGSYQ